MDIRERTVGDLTELKRRVRREKDADRRDRLRAVALALDGEGAPTIARLLGRSRRQVQEWAYAYRNGGIAAIHPASAGTSWPTGPTKAAGTSSTPAPTRGGSSPPELLRAVCACDYLPREWEV